MRYPVILTYEDNYWQGQAADYPEAVDYSDTLHGLAAGMRNAIILAADLREDSDVKIVFYRKPGDNTLPSEVATALEGSERRSELATALADLRANQASDIATLKRLGYSTRDIGTVVGLTAGRVAQIAAS